MNISALTFGRIQLLWFLMGLIPLALLFWRAHRRREELLVKVVAPRLRALLLSSVKPWKRTTRLMLVLLAWGVLVIALAEPRWGYEEKKIVSRGRDVILAIDTSRSMLATDVTPTRLARAELLGQDVLDLLPGDRVGLIAFAGNAFLQAPMTLDHHAVTASLSELDTTLIPKGGTNISEAIRTAEIAFGKAEGTSRALIIMTDGEDLEDDAITAAKEAAGQGIKIFTIGIGSAVGSLIPIKNENGRSDFVRDERGKPVLSKLDETRLKEIAQVTGGFYEPFSSQAARTIVEKGITPLEAGMTGEMSARKPIERYEIPASLAFLLLVFSILLTAGRWRVAVTRTIIIGMFLLGTEMIHATPGIQEYQQGNYEAALKSFEQRLQKVPSSPEVRFDAGAAAYKKGDYQKAEEYFTSAMTASDPKLQQAATYNLANSLVRAGEEQQDRAVKLSDWKNALQHYEAVLKQNPTNKNAKENCDLVKKLIDDLQKQQDEKNSPQNKNQQQDQQQNQQQQSQNQSQDQQQKQDQQQQKQSQDQQQQNQNQQPQQNQSQQQQRSSSSSQQQQQENQSQNQSQPQQNNGSPSSTPKPSPGDQKKEQNSSNQGQQQESSTSTPPPAPPQQKQDQRSSSQQPSQQPNEKSPVVSRPAPGEKKSGALQAAGPNEEAPAGSMENEKEEQGKMSRHQAETILRSVQEEEQQVKFQQRGNSEEVTKDW